MDNGHGFGMILPESDVAFDVSEKEGDSAGW
jgi:hypothetical protein